MRKILLLSLALVLICSLIAAGAIGNSKLTLSSKAKVVRYTGAVAPTAPAIQKEKASKISNPPQLSTSNEVSVAGKDSEVSKNTVKLSPKMARYLESHATAVSNLEKLPVINNVAPPYNPPQIATTYFTEGFENGGAIPAGWNDMPGSFPWLYNDGTGDGMPGSVHSGSYCAYFDVWNYDIGAVDSLISPVINLSGDGNYQLIFWNWDNTDPNGYQDSCAVHIKYGADPWTWLYKVPNSTSGWTQNIVNFSTAETSIQIEFVGWSYFGYSNPCIDDIRVQDPAVNGRCCYGDPTNPSCIVNEESDCQALGELSWVLGADCQSNPCVAVPANDRCEWVQPVFLGDGQTLTFSGDNTGATVDGDCPAFAAYPDVWHAFTIDECMNVTLDYCTTSPAFGNAWLNLAIDCPCSDFTPAGLYDITTCGDNNLTIRWTNLQPGTYYYPVLLDPANNAGPGPYTLHVTGAACPELIPDFIVTAPGTWTDGNTCNAGDDCSLSAGEDQIWEITIPTTGDWTFSLCNTSPSWDTYIYLGTAICSSDIGFNDDGGGDCGLLSKLTVLALPAGTYYLDVEPFTAGDCGPYQLDVTMAQPCDVVCPEPYTPEGEPICYDEYVDATNAGCNATPNVFGSISSGETICATSGTYTVGGVNRRDTDWYLFTTTEAMNFSLEGMAEFPMAMYIITMGTPDLCTGYAVTFYNWVDPCVLNTLSGTIPAGSYVVWVGPGTSSGGIFTGIPCGAEYYVTLTLESAQPCEITCPPNATPEGEPDCYDEYVDVTNGGCNSVPPVYGSVSLGETICGTAGNYLVAGAQYRDTDWYRLSLTQDTAIVVTSVAQFPVVVYVVNIDCDNIQVLAAGSGNPCDTVVVPASLTAGDYNIFVAPGVSVGVPCGSPYYVTVIGVAAPPPPPCEGNNVVYGQPDDGGNIMASQCDASYPFTAGVADDFVLPGTGNVEIDEVVTYAGFWNPVGHTPDDLLGIGITIYADNSGVPGGEPTDGDPCNHQEDVAGGIVYTHDFAPGEFTWSARASGAYQIELPLPTPETLATRTTYWLEFFPHMSFTTSGQVGWFSTSLVTGALAVQGFPLLSIPYWTPNSSGVDVAFCLLGQSVAPPGCVYTPGDVNGNHSVNGVDIVYAVNYLTGRGGPPPIDCFPACPLTPNPFYAAADVNGNCAFNGIDITFFVRYLKLQVPSLLYCADCPPAPGLAVTPNQGGVKAASKNIDGQQ